MNAEAVSWVVTIMTLLTFAWSVYKIVAGAEDRKLIRFIAFALVGLLLIDIYVLIILSSR